MAHAMLTQMQARREAARLNAGLLPNCVRKRARGQASRRSAACQRGGAMMEPSYHFKED